MPDLTPAGLWRQAEREFPLDVSERRRRYRALMVEHGLVVPGRGNEAFPCGWNPRVAACAKCGAQGRVGNPLLTHTDETLLCLRCKKAVAYG